MKPPVLVGRSTSTTMRVQVECPECKGRKQVGNFFFRRSCWACNELGYVLRAVPLPPPDPDAVARALAVPPTETRAQRRERLRRSP